MRQNCDHHSIRSVALREIGKAKTKRKGQAQSVRLRRRAILSLLLAASSTRLYLTISSRVWALPSSIITITNGIRNIWSRGDCLAQTMITESDGFHQPGTHLEIAVLRAWHVRAPQWQFRRLPFGCRESACGPFFRLQSMLWLTRGVNQ